MSLCEQVPMTPITTGLQTIYYYVTFTCNLCCLHCYVGDNLDSLTHADFDRIAATLRKSYDNGARKAVFLGGEPSLHPDYATILMTAVKIGYQSIVVDTNGITNPPIPREQALRERLTIRFSFEGALPQTHDAIRGKGTFARSLRTLRDVIAKDICTEVTFTLNAANISEISEMVNDFTAMGISKLNFHFISLMGNGQAQTSLRLTPDAILCAQEQLEALKRRVALPLRYPKLLIRKDALKDEIKVGCSCRIFGPEILLIFPQGETRRCPLEITPGLTQRVEVRSKDDFRFSGCPLAWRLFPEGVPDGYVMTCISWKSH